MLDTNKICKSRLAKMIRDKGLTSNFCAQNEIWIFEELDFPREILACKFVELHAAPFKLSGCGGSPCRAYAIGHD